MAGPAVGILLPRPFDKSSRIAIFEYIAKLTHDVEGENFWVEGRPFLLILGPEYPEEISEYSGLADDLGWSPVDALTIIAMCNDDIDHRWLGTLTLEIARKLDGVIAFGNLITYFASDPQLPGAGGVADYKAETIFSVDGFEAWLAHPKFRMVK